MSTNDELNKVLIDAINSTKDGVGQAVDFAVAQAPDVIQQLLLWRAVDSIISCLVGLLCFLAIYLFWRFVKSYPQPESFSSGNLVWWDKGELHPLTAIFGGIAVIVLFICAIGLINLTWLKIWIAPKLFLVEYAASLVK